MRSLASFRKPPSNFTMGMELECIVNNGTYDSARYLYHGFWYATTDASISPPTWNLQGMEFVSQPLTKEWLKKEIVRLGKKFQWTHNDSCGIHIHVSRKWINEAKAELIHKFYCTLTAEQQKDLFGRPRNHYCRVEEWKTTRYNAVNVENTDTVEFRMFASGDVKWAQYCVDMADYLVRNARRLNIDAVYAARDLFLN